MDKEEQNSVLGVQGEEPLPMEEPVEVLPSQLVDFPGFHLGAAPVRVPNKEAELCDFLMPWKSLCLIFQLFRTWTSF